MAHSKLSAAVIEQIKSAPAGETHQALAARLACSPVSIKKYRREAREERQEVARGILARHVEETVPDALADLNLLRGMASANYGRTEDARDGSLWLSAIKTTLEHVKPDDHLLDAEIERELEGLAHGGEAATPGAAEGPEGGAG